jgi:hypothetical protein
MYAGIQDVNNHSYHTAGVPKTGTTGQKWPAKGLKVARRAFVKKKKKARLETSSSVSFGSEVFSFTQLLSSEN